MSDLDGLFLLMCSLMVFFMQSGFLCLEAGAARLSSAGHIALKNLSEIAIVGLLFWIVGFGMMFGESFGGLIGTSYFALNFESGELLPDTANFMLFQIAFATTTISIISGAIAERASFAGYLCISAAVACLIYPVIGHAAWAGLIIPGQEGWLAALGFVDFAGGTVVHSTGGWAALAAAVFIGARRGRFGRARGNNFAPSSVALSTLGAMLLWMGWLGFNAGSALVFDAQTPAILVKTTLCAAGGMIFAMLYSLFTRGYVEANGMLAGMLAGLVAGTAGIHSYSTLDAVVVGAFGSVVASFTTTLLVWLKIDDPVNAVSIHLGPGAWGTLAVAFYGAPEFLNAGSVGAQITAQVLGILYCGVWAFGGTMAILFVLNKVVPLRVQPRAEVIGLDAAEHNITPPLQVIRDHHSHSVRLKSRYAALRSEAHVEQPG